MQVEYSNVKLHKLHCFSEYSLAIEREMGPLSLTL